MKYAIVIERSSSGFSAYVPDLPGCVAAAETEEEVRDLIREAIEFHLEGMRESNEPIPEPAARVDYVEIAHAA
jgi:predicted RNase H-like HicB family nuclease